MRVNTRYMLRKAAGSYWLLDMEQDGKLYKEPIELNESGAKIWELASEGMDIPGIAEYLRGQYGIGLEEAREDARQFFAGLRTVGITMEVK